MASRSRTQEFLDLRERARGNRRSGKAVELKDMKGDRTLLRQPGMSDDDASSCENACSITVPPVWMTVVDELNRDIGSIRTKLSELTQDHGRHLLPGFNDEDDKEAKIKRMSTELTQLFKQCEQRMRHLQAENRKPGHDGTSSDDLVRKNILATSATQLQELHFQFRRQQKSYLNSAPQPRSRAHGWGSASSLGPWQGDAITSHRLPLHRAQTSRPLPCSPHPRRAAGAAGG